MRSRAGREITHTGKTKLGVSVHNLFTRDVSNSPSTLGAGINTSMFSTFTAPILPPSSPG